MNSIDFFRDEVRNGFYVPTAIKQAWAATLDILKEIDDICIRHGIRYFADWGTILGAVRHGGFVPWDDDLDICMLREDYDKFRAVADEELPNEFVIHDYERKDNHWLFLARVVNNSMMCFDLEYLNAHNNFPWLAGVDIFIKDGLYDDEADEKARDKEILALIAAADSVRENELERSAIEDRLKEFSQKYKVKLPPAPCDDESRRALAVALYALAEKQMARVPSGSTKLVGQVFPWVLKYGLSAGESSSRYEKNVRLPFENTTIPVPANYNEVLKGRYGNYCEIRKVWNGHDYPFFEGQKKEMEDMSGNSFMRYKFDAGLLNRVVPDKSGSLKEMAKECVAELYRLLAEAEKVCSAGDYDKLTQLLGDMQQLAADLGTLTENVKGEDAACTVRLVADLQLFCDALWEECSNIKDAVTSDSAAAGNLSSSRAALDKVKASVDENILGRKEVLFLPIGPKEWKALLPYYKKAVADEDTDVFVVPLPLMKKNFTGEVAMTDEEIMASVHMDEYPEEARCADFSLYDLALHAPEQVYIQNPYDEANPCLTVPPYYYASNVRNFADEVIYVPIADTAEITKEDVNDLYNMQHYVAAPGVICADRVIVQSENIRERYIEVLTAFAGEDTKPAWEKKITVRESAVEACCDKHNKRLLICIGVNELAEAKDKSFAELLNKKLDVIRDMKEELDVALTLYPEDRKLWEDSDKAVADEVFKVLDDGAASGLYDIISVSARDADEVSREFDAYYGSPSTFVPAFTVAGKPIMIADFGI